MVMPKRNGREVRDAIRARKPDLPVIYCTGYGDGGEPADFTVESGTELIRKPYSPILLIRKVRSMLKMSGKAGG